jgi:hypothetical protein
MFDIIVRERGWMFSPGGARAIWDEANAGAAAGGRRAGSSVFALIQVADGAGNVFALARGDHVHIQHLIEKHHYDRNNEHYHAEEKALNTLKRIIPENRDLHGGTMIVIVDQIPCDSKKHDCRRQLRDYAQSHKLELEVWLPTRDSVRGLGAVSPKTATRTSMRTGYPEVVLVRWRPEQDVD